MIHLKGLFMLLSRLRNILFKIGTAKRTFRLTVTPDLSAVSLTCYLLQLLYHFTIRATKYILRNKTKMK